MRSWLLMVMGGCRCGCEDHYEDGMNMNMVLHDSLK